MDRGYFRTEQPRTTLPGPPTPVVVQQDKPIAVEIWRSPIGYILITLLALAITIQTIAATVFIYAAWRFDKAMAAAQDTLNQWGGGLGG